MSGENRDPRVDPEMGRTLEGARKSRGRTLWQVEQKTRIRSRYLRDLERENFDVLPAVYVLGSLKTYADFLGLDGAALPPPLKASPLPAARAPPRRARRTRRPRAARGARGGAGRGRRVRGRPSAGRRLRPALPRHGGDPDLHPRGDDYRRGRRPGG